VSSDNVHSKHSLSCWFIDARHKHTAVVGLHLGREHLLRIVVEILVLGALPSLERVAELALLGKSESLLGV